MDSEPKIIEVTHHDNFISEFQTNLNGSYIIEYYEWISSNNLVVNRVGNITDQQEFLHELPPEYYGDSLTNSVYRAWTYVTKKALVEYCNKYNILSERNLQQIKCKLQKTLPGQGFHEWHYENTPSEPYRQLTTQLYLNDDYEAGETEFLYQHCRITPKAGKFIISPCAWPWTHRGNPPIDGTKYIATAWIEEFPHYTKK